MVGTSRDNRQILCWLPSVFISFLKSLTDAWILAFLGKNTEVSCACSKTVPDWPWQGPTSVFSYSLNQLLKWLNATIWLCHLCCHWHPLFKKQKTKPPPQNPPPAYYAFWTGSMEDENCVVLSSKVHTSKNVLVGAFTFLHWETNSLSRLDTKSGCFSCMDNSIKHVINTYINF